jgi:iron(III) transport system substrate-binding protein
MRQSIKMWNVLGSAVGAALLLASCSPSPAAPAAATSAPAPTGAPATAKPAAKPTDVPSKVAPTVIVSATASSNRTQDMAKLDEYYQKAKASGQLSIVHYGPGPEYAPMVEVFKQRYPDVQIEMVNLRGTETFQRLSAEAASGRRIANVVSGGSTSLFAMEQQGFMDTWEGPPNAADLPETVPPSVGVRWAITLNVFGVLANTDLVPADKIPSGRQDLLDPFWKGKGKLLFEDPRAGGPGVDWMTIAYADLGQDYLDKLKDQEPTFIRDRDAAPAQIARGEYNMFVPVGVTQNIFDLEKSAPDKIAWLRDGGTPEGMSSIGIIKDASGQDVAKLWASWWVSDEGQRTISQRVLVYPALNGAPPPPGWPSIQEINPHRRTAEQIANTNFYGDIFNNTFFK